MSHLTERNQKNCLNCNAEVHGKYCHICGQENLEPNESLWHLITHFFNDITHFDGKFFSTLGLLLTRPGFLSAEYKMGRRNSYLNPVRMYIFTSFVFFLIFFSVIKPEKDLVETSVDIYTTEDLVLLSNKNYDLFVKDVNRSSEQKVAILSAILYPPAQSNKAILLRYTDSIRKNYINTSPKLHLMRLVDLPVDDYNRLMEISSEMDSSEFANFSKAMYDDTTLTKAQFTKLVDSLRSSNVGFLTIGDSTYKDKATYDSLIKSGKIKDNWFERKFKYRQFEINEKYGGQGSDFTKNVSELLLHYLPQTLFLSLPFFALMLFLLYKRSRSFYYVSHGIYSIHLYITYFIILLLLIFFYKVDAIYNMSIFSVVRNFLFLYLMWYEYKAMRNFYGQSRAKTILKLTTAIIARLFIFLFLLVLFGIISLFKV